MELIRGLHNLRERHHGCVATIGNYDGIHLGHQAVIGQLADEAVRLNLPAVVVTFEPQPMEYFMPDKVPARLSCFREKIEALRRFAVDRMLCLDFNRQLAEMSAEKFIQSILVDGLGIRYLVVGDDFRFGKDRRGDFQMLVVAGQRYGFQVVNMRTFSIKGERVSSTWIRQAMQQGDIKLAEQLLGRDFRMSGRVVHGKKLGRQLGFPTANIFLHRRASPLKGIFVVQVYGLAGEPLPGVASLGTRPTVDGKQVLLEVYLLDFKHDIYGKHIQVSFLEKLREEEKFDSLEALKDKIAEDVQQTRNFFANR